MFSNSIYHRSLLVISSIITFEENRNELLNSLTENLDWDSIVKVASRHLLLPSLYTRLEQKNLLSILPLDLLIYLKEITELNEKRNNELLIETEIISSLFQKHQIDHVFIKGIALLIRGLYTDHKERMIGDIDILVRKDQCEKAFDLLVAEGYSTLSKFNYQNVGFRHYPRQINENKFAAIEIHNSILNLQYSNFIDSNVVLKQKTNQNHVNIPNDHHNLLIAIYSNQITNHGFFYNRLDLKTTFDVISLINTGSILINGEIRRDKYFEKFFQLSSLFFLDLNYTGITDKKRFYRTSFILCNKHRSIARVMFTFKSAYLAIKTRLRLFLFNKSYRKHVISNKL